MSDRRFIVIGNPESPRTVSFAGAVMEVTGARPITVPWCEVLAGRFDWDSIGGDSAIVRVDSPGRNSEVERQLLTLGADEPDESDSAATTWTRWSRVRCESWSGDTGRIVPSRQWYLGFRRALSLVREEVDRRVPRPQWMTPAANIAQMFDKEFCQRMLAEGGCRVPALLGVPQNFDHLIERMRQRGLRRVFLKLCHGSSASGAVALEQAGSRLQAFSTARMAGADEFGQLRIYNSRTVLRYDSLEEIGVLINALCAERVLAEAWIPKAGMQGHRFDVRVVPIAGRARHLVVRLAKGPFTNLQLGARRATADDLAMHFGPSSVAAIRAAAEQALRQFPGSLYAGVDVVWEAGRQSASVLEVNAFGDLLPRVHDNGDDTYLAEVKAMIAQVSV